MGACSCAPGLFQDKFNLVSLSSYSLPFKIVLLAWCHSRICGQTDALSRAGFTDGLTGRLRRV